MVNKQAFVKDCKFCFYSWQARVEQPKSCPRCKRRFDYEEAKEILKRVGKEFGFDLDISAEMDKGGYLNHG
jgi:hypothetical protein